MMPFGIAIDAVLVLVSLLGQASGYAALPKENSLSKYRVQPEFFHHAWHPPQRLNGAKRGTDVMCYNLDQTKERTWMDILYPFEWERAWAASEVSAACRKYWWVSHVATTMYLLGVWVGPSLMETRRALNLRGLLTVWNLFLAVFSFLGMLRTVPQLGLILKTFGFEYSVCRAAQAGYGNGASGLWVTLFVFSKYVELIDTLFLILRKRKVGFLHWVHHASVLLYCWHAFMWEMPTGIYFASMNYTVHTIMYFYYFIAAVIQRPLSWGIYVTVLQILQMMVGILINVAHLVFLVRPASHCDGHLPNLAAAMLMYGLYLYLFVEFLVNRYCGHRKDRGAGLKSKKQQ